jgi:hypothetical protein
MTATVGVGPIGAAAGASAGDLATKKRLFGIFLLILLGVSFVATWLLREEPVKCGPFTIGEAAIGGCDGLGGKPSPLSAILKRAGLKD